MSARDLHDASYLVTGGTSGIGEAAARLLAARGATVLITGRDRGRGQAVQRELTQLGARAAVFLPADLARFDDVERLAGEVSALAPRLNGVLHIAGVLHFRREETADGLEMTFQTQYLSRWLLTDRLLPQLERSGSGRVVVLAAALPSWAKLRWNDIHLRDSYSAWKALSQVHVANALTIQAVAPQLGAQGVTVHGYYCGPVPSRVGRHAPWLMSAFFGMITRAFGLPAARAAANAVWAATSPDAPATSGHVLHRPRVLGASKPIDRPADEVNRAMGLLADSLGQRGIGLQHLLQISALDSSSQARLLAREGA